MAEFAIQVRNPGFIDRFLRSDKPPESIGMSIWWATKDEEIIRFRSRATAERIIRDYELYFAAKGEKSYTFVLMQIVMVPEWQEASPASHLEDES